VSLRNNPLWTAERKPTPFLLAQWRDKAALEPLQSRVAYLDEQRRATPVMRGLWAAAFPSREPLPLEPIADRQGVGSSRFWDVFA